MKIFNHHKIIIVVFAVITAVMGYFASTIYFSYDFEHFFPKGDPDLDFYYQFREQFERDDNFLLIALENKEGIYKEDFLVDLEKATKFAQQLEPVVFAQSITNFTYFIRGGFGDIIPLKPLDVSSNNYDKDSIRFAQDVRVYGNLISEDQKTAVIALKIKEELEQELNEFLIDTLNIYLSDLSIDDYHILGKANFQTVLIRTQKWEFLISSLISALLVCVVFLLVYRKALLLLLALLTVSLCMLFLLGILGALNAPLDIMSALYPILMLIVGVSDVVHFTSKYVEGLENGLTKKDSMRITIREIGLATFLTSFTTAIGFVTLVTSKVQPVRTFGFMGAIGVLLAYIIVLFFTTSVLSLMKKEQVISERKPGRFWRDQMDKAYHFQRKHANSLLGVFVFVFILALIGLSKVSTDVQIQNTLPKGDKLTEDFVFFEKQLGGFRPFEIAVMAQGENKVTDEAVIRECEKLENHLKDIDIVKSTSSYTDIYKSLNRAFNGNNVNYYSIPSSSSQINRFNGLLDKMQGNQLNILISENKKAGRISSKIHDVGTDSIKSVINNIKTFIDTETDASIVTFRQTGTGVLFDKNNEYLRGSLIGGLSMAFIAISIIMALLFRSFKMVIISLIPNVLPLLIGAAVLGFSGIKLDAATSIIFAISFGIAVDDTIHFLSKYKLEILKGSDTETAIRNTFLQAGKAITVTTIILFFGFMILLFSSTPGTYFVGLLVSVTLFSALLCDLFLLPYLLRKWQ